MTPVTRGPRTSTIRVTDADGVPWEGTGENLSRALGDLVRRHTARLRGAGHPAEASEQNDGDFHDTHRELTRRVWEVVARLNEGGGLP